MTEPKDIHSKEYMDWVAERGHRWNPAITASIPGWIFCDRCKEYYNEFFTSTAWNTDGLMTTCDEVIVMKIMEC